MYFRRSWFRSTRPGVEILFNHYFGRGALTPPALSTPAALTRSALSLVAHLRRSRPSLCSRILQYTHARPRSACFLCAGVGSSSHVVYHMVVLEASMTLVLAVSLPRGRSFMYVAAEAANVAAATTAHTTASIAPSGPGEEEAEEGGEEAPR